MYDFEDDAAWLDGLYRLNAVVQATGEPLIGNLFYEHLEEGWARARPIDAMRPKRDRFRQAVAGRRRLLEIGVNGGHSAYLALTSNPDLEFHGVDICEMDYVKPAVEWLQAEFPGRVFLYEGSSLTVVPELVQREERFDCFHVDGAKWLYYMDLLNCTRMVADSGDALVVMDDVQLPAVGRKWVRAVRQGLVTPDPAFPSMSTSIKGRNEVGSLHRVSQARWVAYHNEAKVEIALRPVWPPLRRVAHGVMAGPAQRVANRFGYTIVESAHLNWLNEVRSVAERAEPTPGSDRSPDEQHVSGAAA